MFDASFIDGRCLTIEPDEEGRVRLRYPNGEEHSGVRPRRLFPLTRPRTHIRFIGEDDQEVGILKDTSELGAESRKCLEGALERYYLIPRIVEIHSLEEEYGVTQWDVTTDRGKRVFDVRSRTTDITVLPPRRVLIRDSDDNRYEIPDYNELPPRSRMLLEGEI